MSWISTPLFWWCRATQFSAASAVIETQISMACFNLARPKVLPKKASLHPSSCVDDGFSHDFTRWAKLMSMFEFKMFHGYYNSPSIAIIKVVRKQIWGQPCCRDGESHAGRQTGRQTVRKPAELTLPLSTWTDPPSLSAVRWEPSSSRLVTGVGWDSLPLPSGD